MGVQVGVPTAVGVITIGVTTGVITRGVAVGSAVNVAPTACCTATANASVVAVASGVTWRVTGTGVAIAVAVAKGMGVGAGGSAVSVPLTPATISAFMAFPVAVKSMVTVGGSPVVVKVGTVVLLPPVLAVKVTIGSAPVGPAKRSPKK